MPTTLGDFIKSEIEKRGMSAREFATLVGVAPSTITTYLSGQGKTEPTLSFLHKLAKQTDTPLGTIIAFAYPDVAGELSTLPPETVLLAIRISKLPKTHFDMLQRVVSSYEEF